jgi:hypothetical protein
MVTPSLVIGTATTSKGSNRGSGKTRGTGVNVKSVPYHGDRAPDGPIGLKPKFANWPEESNGKE